MFKRINKLLEGKAKHIAVLSFKQGYDKTAGMLLREEITPEAVELEVLNRHFKDHETTDYTRGMIEALYKVSGRKIDMFVDTNCDGIVIHRTRNV